MLRTMFWLCILGAVANLVCILFLNGGILNLMAGLMCVAGNLACYTVIVRERDRNDW